MDKPELRGGRITSLEPQRRNPDRLNVYLDGRFACGVSRRTADDRGLYVGRDVDPGEMLGILGEEEVRRARDHALLLISYRPRSRVEMETRLTHKGIAATLVKQVLDELESAGLLDDIAFAESWVSDRQRNRPRGKELLRWELRRKGVDSTVIESTLGDIEPEDEVALARALAEKRLSREKGRDRDDALRRVSSFLQRRGFRWETIRAALSALESDGRSDDSRMDSSDISGW